MLRAGTIMIRRDRPIAGNGLQGAELAMAEEERDLQGRDAARPAGGYTRHTRRLSDKILIAFHHACDQGDFEVAEDLLRILERMLTRRPVPADINRRKNMESLVAAHERLWLLRHPEAHQG